ncbi:MAG TPA: hypothetical protein VNT55_03580 [Baekduia sp.]|nr:hypothetical protein [Baekduia sp.]
MVDGVVHYCVANMPGAVAATSTAALTNATHRGWRDRPRRRGCGRRAHRHAGVTRWPPRAWTVWLRRQVDPTSWPSA